MRLSELNAKFYGISDPLIYSMGKPLPRRSGIGVSFDCPCGCGDRCYIPFSNPLDCGPAEPNITGKAWKREGDTIDTLTLSPSVQRIGGCQWHGNIKDGNVQTI